MNVSLLCAPTPVKFSVFIRIIWGKNDFPHNICAVARMRCALCATARWNKSFISIWNPTAHKNVFLIKIRVRSCVYICALRQRPRGAFLVDRAAFSFGLFVRIVALTRLFCIKCSGCWCWRIPSSCFGYTRISSKPPQHEHWT